MLRLCLIPMLHRTTEKNIAVDQSGIVPEQRGSFIKIRNDQIYYAKFCIAISLIKMMVNKGDGSEMNVESIRELFYSRFNRISN